MKKVFYTAVIIFPVLMFVIMQLTVSAITNGTCGTNVIWTLDDSGTLIISGAGEMRNYAGNGAPWNSSKQNIKTIIIKNGITSIGSATFNNCINLNSVTMPDSVTIIGDSAFASCSALKSIELSGNLTCIKSAAFAYSGLTSVSLPANLTNIENWAFANCNNITQIDWNAKNIADFSETVRGFPNVGDNTLGVTVTFAEGIERVPAYVFCGAKKITNIVLPDTLRSIGAYSFAYSGLTSIRLPKNLTYIANCAFDSCDNLAKINWDSKECDDFSETVRAFQNIGNNTSGVTVNFGESVERVPAYIFNGTRNITNIIIKGEDTVSIGIAAFEKCINLASITMSDSITSIGDSAFAYCSALKTIDLPAALTTIGSAAFAYSGLTSVSLPANLTNIENWAFANCNSITRINWHSKNVKDFSEAVRAFPNIGSDDNGIVVNFAYDVERVPAYTFYGSRNVTDVILPDTLKSIGKFAFNLTNYYNDSNNWENNVFYIDNSLIEAKKDLTGEYRVRDGTKLIGEYAFSDCVRLTSIIVPNSVDVINEYAFYNCIGLKSIEIPFTGSSRKNSDGYKAMFGYIFGSAQEEATNTTTQSHEDGISYYYIPELLATVTVNDTVEIPEGAFNNCDSITTVTVNNCVESIGNAAFYDCDNLVTVILKDGITSISNFLFYECDSLKNVIIPNTVTEIGAYSFCNCKSLSEFVMPESVKIVGKNAFYGTEYYNNKKNWEKNALYIDKYLIEVESSINGAYTIRENTECIADHAFDNCNGLTDITIPKGVIYIGDYAFYSCGELTEVVIPNSVIRIGDFAFSNCELLEKVIIPESVVEIGNFAFSYCSALKDIVIPDSVNYIGDSVFCYCNSLENVTIPCIPYRTFYACKGLTDISINKGIENIGAYAFGECSGLNIITIPQSVTNVETGAFEGCVSIKKVNYEGNKENFENLSIDIKNECLLESEIIRNYDVHRDVNVEFSQGTFIVTPVGALKDEIIIFVCYNDKKVSYIKHFVYDGSSFIQFTPDTEYDNVKVLIWDGLNSMKPLCGAKNIEIPQGNN